MNYPRIVKLIFRIAISVGAIAILDVYDRRQSLFEAMVCPHFGGFHDDGSWLGRSHGGLPIINGGKALNLGIHSCIYP